MPAKTKRYRAAADLYLSGQIVQAGVVIDLDPSDPAVKAFVRAGKLAVQVQSKSNPDPE
jgi:hypothetical protein